MCRCSTRSASLLSRRRCSTLARCHSISCSRGSTLLSGRKRRLALYMVTLRISSSRCSRRHSGRSHMRGSSSSSCSSSRHKCLLSRVSSMDSRALRRLSRQCTSSSRRSRRCRLSHRQSSSSSIAWSPISQIRAHSPRHHRAPPSPASRCLRSSSSSSSCCISRSPTSLTRPSSLPQIRRNKRLRSHCSMGTRCRRTLRLSRQALLTGIHRGTHRTLQAMGSPLTTSHRCHRCATTVSAVVRMAVWTHTTGYKLHV